MDFLKEEQSLMFTSKKYEEVYVFFEKKLEIKYQQLFILCASLGFKKNVSKALDGKGREFRSNYLKTSERTTVYLILLNDQELGKNIEAFSDKDFQLKSRRKLEMYAEGGMDILVKDVFRNRWNGLKLDESYKEYEVDILSYIYADSKEIPF
ncbi:hypothetical protein DVV91_08960 [Clostridium botulinum]|uniref:hypothetical protein n=1 Tax=Clostridium botulinum TaxID=1491 RepID=UPI0013F8F7CF|nr:hypothetical protein [Clostridium botulinum]MBN1074469.1 hypothetical protein [Clostridium botulinum]NFE61256.1 hypothetical protein [Clostridium botulinum]NFG11473.1 hypothetical protein [Clostridium botulinum]NFI51769.1 hypothetical protein [Clostridium botulinum]NFL57876.1 hypothetical protein [Clostridium botulinum]